MSSTQQGLAAVGFLVMAFTDEQTADQVLDRMKQAKKQQQFYFEEAAVIRQDGNGHVHYHETGDMSTGKGAGIGALVGGMIGILGGPPGMALGVGAGAALGSAIAHRDKGFRNEGLSTVGVALKPGTSAVAAITSSDVLKAVHERVPVEEIRTAVSNLAAELSRRLGENKDVAIGLLLAEEGLVVKEIAADENSAVVAGAVITPAAAVAGAAILTAEGGAYRIGAVTTEGAVLEEGVFVADDPTASGSAAAPDAEAKPPAAAEPPAEPPADAPSAAAGAATSV